MAGKKMVKVAEKATTYHLMTLGHHILIRLKSYCSSRAPYKAWNKHTLIRCRKQVWISSYIPKLKRSENRSTAEHHNRKCRDTCLGKFQNNLAFFLPEQCKHVPSSKSVRIMLNRVAVVASNVLIYMQMIIQYIGWPIETEKKKHKLENRKPQIRLKQKYKSHNGIPKHHNETNIQTKNKSTKPKKEIQNPEHWGTIGKRRSKKHK